MTHKVLSYCSDWWSTRAPRGQFWTYFSGALFFNFGFTVFFFLFNVYLVGRGFNERSLGVLGSLLAAGGLCGTIPAGILAERIGLRWTLVAGIVLTCAVSLLQVMIVWMPAQYLLAMLSGFALSSWGVCLSPAVAGLTSEQQRPAAFSLTFASGIGVGVLGGVAAGYLPSFVVRFSQTPLSNTQAEKAVLLFMCCIAILALVPISQIALRCSAPRKRLGRLSSPFLRKFLVAMAVWGVVTGGFAPFANVYFVHHLGLSLHAMGSIFSLSQLIQVSAILLGPLLFRRLSLSTGVMLSQFVTAAMLLLLAFAHTFAYAAWLYCAYMAAQYMNEPGIYSLLMDSVEPSERNGASSYTSFIGSGSRIVASTAVGYSIIHFGYFKVLAGMAALAVIAALLFRRLPRVASSPATSTATVR
jgi:MFS family permease